MVKVTIKEPRLRTIITPEGRFMDVYEVPFEIAGNTYFITIPKEEFSPSEVEKRVAEEAKKIASILGRTLEV